MNLTRQVLILTLSVLALTGGGYPVTVRLWGVAALPALYWAAGCCLLAGLASLCPLAVASRMGAAEFMPQAAFAGMVLRILLTGGFMLLLTGLDVVAYWPFATWLMVFYACLLTLETAIALTYVKGFRQAVRQGGRGPA